MGLSGVVWAHGLGSGSAYGTQTGACLLLVNASKLKSLVFFLSIGQTKHFWGAYVACCSQVLVPCTICVHKSYTIKR